MRRSLAAFFVLLAAGPAAPAAADAKVFRGKLVVRHSDDFRNGRGDTTWKLRTADGRRIPVLPTRPTKLRSGTRVAIRGSRKGRFIRGAVRRRGGASLRAASALGSRSVAVVLLNFASDAREPWTPAYVDQRIFTDASSTAAFYAEQSGGDIDVSGDVFGWYTVAGPTTGCDVDAWAGQAREAADDAGDDLSGYDHLMFVFPRQPSCGWAGLGELPGSQTWLNGDISVRVAAHELGHNIGLHHASSYACSAAGGPVTLGTSCTKGEYGDPFDVMGLNARHSNAWHLSKLGVLSGSAVRTVTASGTYTIRAPRAGGTAPALLRVPAGGTPARWYDLSLRQPGCVFGNYLSNDPVVNGVSLHYDPSPTAITQSLLLDGTPESGNGFLDAALAPGRTFSNGSVSIAVTSAGAGTATVSVVTGAPADAQPPTAPTGLRASTRPGVVDLSWGASSDDVGVAGYRVYRDDVLAASTPSTGWSDPYMAPGSTHKYRVAAYDAAGNATMSAAVFATVPFEDRGDPAEPPPPSTDAQAPAVRVLSPRRGARLRRRATIRARAYDNVGVTRTALAIDGDEVASVAGGRLKRTSRLRGVSPGRHRLTVRAHDAAGNVRSRTVRVRVLGKKQRSRR